MRMHNGAQNLTDEGEVMSSVDDLRSQLNQAVWLGDKRAEERDKAERQLNAVRTALKAHPDSDLVALAEATARQSDQFVEAYDRAKDLEQQVAVLREALDATRECAFRMSMGHAEDDEVRLALSVSRAALSTTQPTGWVRLADVERVMGPVLAVVYRPDSSHLAAARAWLHEVKR